MPNARSGTVLRATFPTVVVVVVVVDTDPPPPLPLPPPPPPIRISRPSSSSIPNADVQPETMTNPLAPKSMKPYPPISVLQKRRGNSGKSTASMAMDVIRYRHDRWIVTDSGRQWRLWMGYDLAFAFASYVLVVATAVVASRRDVGGAVVVVVVFEIEYARTDIPINNGAVCPGQIEEDAKDVWIISIGSNIVDDSTRTSRRPTVPIPPTVVAKKFRRSSLRLRRPRPPPPPPPANATTLAAIAR
jgi:hypothetical protein